MDSPLRAVETNAGVSCYKTLLVGVDGATHGDLSLENLQCTLGKANFAGELRATYWLDNIVAECDVFKPELLIAIALALL